MSDTTEPTLPVHVLRPVEPGSIVLVDMRSLPPEQEFVHGLRDSIVDRVGHEEFLLVILPFVADQPPMQVYGPDDLKALLRQPDPEPEERGFCGRCGASWEGKDMLDGAKLCTSCGFTWSGYYGPDDHTKVPGFPA